MRYVDVGSSPPDSSNQVILRKMASLLAKIFSSHAVLQRGVPIPIYGFVAPATVVDATLGNMTLRGTADAGGRWSVEFPALAAGGPYTLSANSTDANEMVEDVYVGDVVLCSGQVRR
jgi:sialate O-acetylesterase